MAGDQSSATAVELQGRTTVVAPLRPWQGLHYQSYASRPG